MGAEMVETLTRICASLAFNNQPPFRIVFPNYYRILNELGITFLYTEQSDEQKDIENIFTAVLEVPDADDSIKFVALTFLKHPSAVVSSISKKCVAEFESNPDNVAIVNAVKKRSKYY